jgi:Ca2+-transporting ATPase
VRSFTGADFDALGEAKQKEALRLVVENPSGFVFSRTDPSNKRSLIKILSNMNQIVSMTGDGVNDAPALK